LENMDVRINKAGEQNHAVGVDFLKGLDIIRRIARPEPCYPVAPDGNRAMVDHAVTFIHRLDRGVSYDQIIGFHIITSIIRAEGVRIEWRIALATACIALSPSKRVVVLLIII